VLDVLRDGGARRDAGDTCVLAGVTERARAPARPPRGHLDTVPAQDNRPAAATATRSSASAPPT
jgi:succinyl-diaminopimelate desuccinylase